MGLCDGMAVALHHRTGLPLGLWRGYFPDPDDEDNEMYEDCHAVVVISFDKLKWIDVDGVHVGMPDCRFTEPVTRVELVPATEDVVWEAFTAFDDTRQESLRRANAFINQDQRLLSLINNYKDTGAAD